MKKIILFCVILLCFQVSYAQEVEKVRMLSDKVFFGGSFGLQLGTVTLVDVSPFVGYRITPRFNLGLGANYMYYSNSFYDYKTNVYGGSAFAQFFPLEMIYLHTELENLSTEYYDTQYNLTREWVQGAFAGVGYMQRFGKRGGMYLHVLYNFNYTWKSPYNSEWVIETGFIF